MREDINNNEKSFREHNYDYGREIKSHYLKSNFIDRNCRCFEGHRSFDVRGSLSDIQLINMCIMPINPLKIKGYVI